MTAPRCHTETRRGNLSSKCCIRPRRSQRFSQAGTGPCCAEPPARRGSRRSSLSHAWVSPFRSFRMLHEWLGRCEQHLVPRRRRRLLIGPGDSPGWAMHTPKKQKKLLSLPSPTPTGRWASDRPRPGASIHSLARKRDFFLPYFSLEVLEVDILRPRWVASIGVT